MTQTEPLPSRNLSRFIQRAYTNASISLLPHHMKESPLPHHQHKKFDLSYHNTTGQQLSVFLSEYLIHFYPLRVWIVSTLPSALTTSSVPPSRQNEREELLQFHFLFEIILFYKYPLPTLNYFHISSLSVFRKFELSFSEES